MSQQGFPQQGFGPPSKPMHPQAQTAMILGIVSVAGGLSCWLPIFVSPLAWYYGARVKREIAAEPERWSGTGEAQAGFILGIIGTALLGLMVIVLIIAAIILGVAIATESTY